MSSRLLILIPALAPIVVGCGGSTCETPWPVEPQGIVMDPVGEAPDEPVVQDKAAAGDRYDPLDFILNEPSTPRENKDTEPPQQKR